MILDFLIYNKLTTVGVECEHWPFFFIGAVFCRIINCLNSLYKLGKGEYLYSLEYFCGLMQSFFVLAKWNLVFENGFWRIMIFYAAWISMSLVMCFHIAKFCW